MARIHVAMSGGVDSSVAAALLVEAGHDVSGVTMRLGCVTSDAVAGCTVDPVESAAEVCRQLGIEHRVLDMAEQFQSDVEDAFINEYATGRTPNPCVVCNERVKFGTLFDAVCDDADTRLATGHYARVRLSDEGRVLLAKGSDSGKDQSYFLYRLREPIIGRLEFPLGELLKSDVRGVARRLGLHTSDRPDSQEVCFIPGGDRISYLRDRAPHAFLPGAFLDEDGNEVGAHAGIARYTVGQRKGLGLPGGPWYVRGIDAVRNVVMVGGHASIARTHIEASDAVWRDTADRRRVEVAVRYRATLVPAWAEHSEGRLSLALDDAVHGVSPGQAVVCYAGDVVVGGGVVETTR